MDIFVLTAVGILGMMAGYWAGRSVQWRMAEQMAEGAAELLGEESAVQVEPIGMGMEQKRILLGQAIGSPVTGTMSSAKEDGKVVVRITPSHGKNSALEKIYAPVSGRITRLYPMGRALRLRTEFGAELMIRVGNHVDEMHSAHYRCRVMEHEVVCKGDLLLEYDVDGLLAEGAEAEVTLSVENQEPDTISVAGNMCVKAGEGVLWVRNHSLARRVK